jgi:hypothetical protein
MSLADLTTEEIALFQLIEQGFVGISNGITIVRAEDAKTGEPVAVLVAFKPGIEAGSFQVEPVARLLTDPSEVINPQFEHTDGAGNVKEQAGGDNDNPTKPSRNKGNGSAH